MDPAIRHDPRAVAGGGYPSARHRAPAPQEPAVTRTRNRTRNRRNEAGFTLMEAVLATALMATVVSLTTDDGFFIPTVGGPDAPMVTPILATFPLFASGLGVLGLLGWRRKRQAAARHPRSNRN
jgi:hypothetical protein